MAEVWATALSAVGTAVSIGGTIASLAASPGSPGNPPKFKKIDEKAVGALAAQTDRASYALSDLKYKERFPDLVKARDYMRGDIVSNMAGGISPVVTDTLNKAGVGGANLGSDVFNEATALGRPILSLQNRGRGYFAQEVGMNPERQIGLTGQDIAHIRIANIGSQNNFNQGLFGLRFGQYQQQAQQAAQINEAVPAALAGIIRSGANLYNDVNSLNPNYYAPSVVNPFTPVTGNTPTGYPGTSTIG